MVRARATGLLITVAATSLLISGCTGYADRPPPDDAPGTPPGNAVPEPSPTGSPVLDAPTRFDPDRAVALPDEATRSNRWGAVVGPPIVLHETTAYIATPNRMLAVDVTTGQVTATVSPRREPAFGDDNDRFVRVEVAPPALVNLDGASSVVVAFLVTVPGSGTTPDENRVEIHIVEAEEPTATQSFEVALEGATYPPAVVGVAGGTLVLDHEHTTVGIDLASRRVSWQKEEVRPSLLVGSAVIGIEDSGGLELHQRVTGLDVADGSQLWIDAEESYQALRLQPAGPKYVVVSGRYYRGQHYYRFVDPMTGETTGDSNEARTSYDISCHYDGVSVTVCDMPRSAWAGGFDASVGGWLWNLPDDAANRVAPTVTGARHGAVYGEVDDRPVVLNARTGEDVDTDPGVAPFVVNEHVGLARSDRAIFAYPVVA